MLQFLIGYEEFLFPTPFIAYSLSRPKFLPLTPDPSASSTPNNNPPFSLPSHDIC